MWSGTDSATKDNSSMPTSNRPRLWLIVSVVVGVMALGVVALCITGLGVVMLLAGRWQATAQADTIIYQQDVQYGTGGGQPLLMDIARPKHGDGPFPAVVCIHGGGWRGGNKSVFRAFVKTLARQGYVAMTIRYRFAPAHRFPAQIEDAKCAVRYLRAHANELKVDSDRIGAMGGSAGGHLALLLGTTSATDDLEGQGGYGEYSSRVQAVASIAGPVDLSQPFPDAVQQMLTDFVGGAKDQVATAYQRASPISYLSADDPPILAIHGTVDELVPYAQALLLMEACNKLGIEASLITIPGGGHGSGGKPQDWLAANAKIIEFFDKHLKQRQATPSAPRPNKETRFTPSNEPARLGSRRSVRPRRAALAMGGRERWGCGWFR
jgi:acetyl esterase/lipase